MPSSSPALFSWLARPKRCCAARRRTETTDAHSGAPAAAWHHQHPYHDPLVGNPFRAKQRGLPPWLDPAAQRMIFRHADVVIANTDVVAEGWSRRYPQWRGKFRVIWNSFDPAGTLAPAPIPPRPSRVLSHIGNLYNSRRPDLLLASLARLVARGMLDPQRLLVQLLGPMEDGVDLWASVVSIRLV